MTHPTPCRTPSLMRNLLRNLLLATSLLGFVALPISALAADDLNSKQIIDALKPSEAPVVRTRSLRNLSVEQTAAVDDKPKSISLTIGFLFNSAQITPESASTLNTLAKALSSQELQALSFRVEGHTDGKGTSDYNLKLSQQRADAVKAFLINQGIAGARLQSQGKGDTELANTQDRFAAENRRVKIVTLTP